LYALGLDRLYSNRTFLVYSGKSEKVALETSLIQQSLEQTDLNSATNQHDTSANNCAPCLYDTNTDQPQADAPKQQLQSLQFAMQRDASNITFTDNPLMQMGGQMSLFRSNQTHQNNFSTYRPNCIQNNPI